MRGLTLTALFGLVGFLLGHLVSPNDIKGFSIVAAAGAMSGFAIGEAIAQRTKSIIMLAINVFIGLAICVPTAFFSLALPNWGWTGARYMIAMTGAIVVCFFSFFYLMAFAGVVVRESADPPGS